VGRCSTLARYDSPKDLLYLSFDTSLDAQARRQAMSTLGQLDWLNGLAVNTSDDLIDAARALHLDFSRTNLTRDLAEIERAQREFRGTCVKHVDLRL
jgi:post-segregation antitoxin (ccd killing protein)